MDTSTGVGTSVGALGITGANALASDRNGNLYGAGITLLEAGVFFRVDTLSGLGTVIGYYGSGYQPWGDIAFAPDGRLFGTALSSSGTGVLVTIDGTTGIATPVSGTSIGVDKVWGLAFVGTDLLGVTATATNEPGQLVSIGLSTGVATTLRPLAFSAFGAGSAPKRAAPQAARRR